MDAVNFLLRAQAGAVSDTIKEETAADQGQWKGITETEEPAIDHENEFIDDDRFTTVIVEAVEVSKDRLHDQSRKMRKIARSQVQPNLTASHERSQLGDNE